MTRFSIVTCCYNAAETLPRTLASIESQSIALEHVLVDGGSTDGSVALLKRYGDTAAKGHAVRWSSEPDDGIYHAMNKGIGMASGELIGILNADDVYADATVLQEVSDLFQDPEVEMVYGNLLYVREQAGREQFTRYWKAGPFDPVNMYAGWMPPHPTCFLRRNVYERLGTFRLDLGTAADYEILLRFLLVNRLRVAYLDRVLVHMGLGGVSSASVGNRLRAHAMDRKAWRVNHLRPRPWTLPLKPLRKLGQWWAKPPTTARASEVL